MMPHVTTLLGGKGQGWPRILRIAWLQSNTLGGGAFTSRSCSVVKDEEQNSDHQLGKAACVFILALSMEKLCDFKVSWST